MLTLLNTGLCPILFICTFLTEMVIELFVAFPKLLEFEALSDYVWQGPFPLGEKLPVRSINICISTWCRTQKEIGRK